MPNGKLKYSDKRRDITDFMIEFKTLTIKTKTNNTYTIFLLKKNIRSNIILIILKYLSITVPESLKKWKIAIILVG